MPNTSRRAKRGSFANRPTSTLPDGIGGTITGGPMRSIDLMTVLAQTSGAANVVPGAAQVLAVRALAGTKNAVVETAVALSDGSRISFVSMDRVLAFA